MIAGDEYELVILEPWGGYNIGDIVAVKAGMYDTLLNLKKAVKLDCYEDEISNKQKLVITIKNLEKENEDLEKENEKQRAKIENLRDKLEDYEKDKVSLPPQKKKLKQYRNKMLTTYCDR